MSISLASVTSVAGIPSALKKVYLFLQNFQQKRKNMNNVALLFVKAFIIYSVVTLTAGQGKIFDILKLR